MSRFVRQAEMNFRAHRSVELQFEEFSFAPGVEKFCAGCLDGVTARRVCGIRKAYGRLKREEQGLARWHGDVERRIVRMLSARGCGWGKDLAQSVCGGVRRKIGDTEKTLAALALAKRAGTFICDDLAGDQMGSASGLAGNDYCGPQACRGDELTKHAYGPVGFALGTVLRERAIKRNPGEKIFGRFDHFAAAEFPARPDSLVRGQ